MSEVIWATAKEPVDLNDAAWINRNSAPVQPMFQEAAQSPQKPRHSSLPPKPAEPSAPPPQAPEPAPPMPDPALVAEQERRLALLANAIETLADAAQKETQKQAETVLNFALQVAEQLAAGAIEADSSRLIALITEAIELMEEGKGIKVLLNPVLLEDLAATGHLDQLNEIPQLLVRPDPNITDIGCIVESAECRVDARVQSRLEQVRHILKEQCGGEQ